MAEERALWAKLDGDGAGAGAGDGMVTPQKSVGADMRPRAGKLLFEDAEEVQMQDLSGKQE